MDASGYVSQIIRCVVVQAMKVLNRAVSLSETLSAEAQQLIATDSVSSFALSRVRDFVTFRMWHKYFIPLCRR